MSIFSRARGRILATGVVIGAALLSNIGIALADQTIPLSGTGTNYSGAFEKVLYSWNVPAGALFTGISGSVSTNASWPSFNEALISVQELTSGTCPTQGEVFWDYGQLFARYPSSLGLAQNIVKNVAGGAATIPVNFTVPGGGIPISHCVYVILDGSILRGGAFTMSSNMTLHYTTDTPPTNPVSITSTGDESCFNMAGGCGDRHTTNTSYSFANYGYPVAQDTDVLAFHGDISSSAITADLAPNFGFTPASGAWTTTDDFYVLRDCTNTPRGWQNAADWYSRLPNSATKIFSLTLQGSGIQTAQQAVDKDFTGIQIPKNGCLVHVVKESGAGGITTENQVSVFTRVSTQQTGACSFNGQVVSNGSSVTAYKDANVSYGQQCVSETRTCTNGMLSGSYTNTSCVVTQAQPPVITAFSANPSIITQGATSTLSWSVSNATSLSISGIGKVSGASLAVLPASTTTYLLTAANTQGTSTARVTVTVNPIVGGTLTFTASPLSGTAPLAVSFRESAPQGSVLYGRLSFGDGTIGALYPAPVCVSCQQLAIASHIYANPGVYTAQLLDAVGTAKASVTITATNTTSTSCSFNGQTIPDGGSVIAYQSSNANSALLQCASEVRYCKAGVLTGSYQYATCAAHQCDPWSSDCTIIGGASSCTLDGIKLASGQSYTFYSARSVTSPNTCSAISQSRTCTNGVLSGTSAYQYASCSVTTGTGGGCSLFQANCVCSADGVCSLSSIPVDRNTQLASALVAAKALLAQIQALLNN